jgi:YD repeat-containing protein
MKMRMSAASLLAVSLLGGSALAEEDPVLNQSPTLWTANTYMDRTVWVTVYDLGNRVIAVINPLGKRTSYAYNGNDDLVRTQLRCELPASLDSAWVWKGRISPSYSTLLACCVVPSAPTVRVTTEFKPLSFTV